MFSLPNFRVSNSPLGTTEKRLCPLFLYFVDIAAAHGALPFTRKQNHFSRFQGLLYIDDILVGGSAEKQGSVLELFLERAVHENVDIREQLPTGVMITDLAL